ncbi:MAG: 23S rRNA (guanosine(2251)-2'-O)-methyltransferase RlmB, partial [Alphaproteobacteria bacterium]|nr:23S rRNA (guanosine(2251)-2'-O)-methyltransferase RlmB [Alphaproteobacteria bacterium]
IIVPKDNSAPISAIVTKVSSGASENMPIVRVTNLARTIEALKKQGVWVYGADENAPQTLYNLDAKGDIAIVMGSEGYGLRQLTKSTCDGLFSLPMQGTVESLNVSVATGVSLYEVVRQRV